MYLMYKNHAKSKTDPTKTLCGRKLALYEVKELEATTEVTCIKCLNVQKYGAANYAMLKEHKINPVTKKAFCGILLEPCLRCEHVEKSKLNVDKLQI